MMRFLRDQSIEVVGLDNLSPLPKHDFKLHRLSSLNFDVDKIEYNVPLHADQSTFINLDLNDEKKLRNFFDNHEFDFVLHLAAQTGVRYSVEQPLAYIDNNIRAFCSLLECCKESSVKNVLYSSSSSVYGLSNSYPFEEDAPTHHPLSVYAVTKKADELLAHSYSSLYALPTTGLRFFTVYGPWTRIDMAVYLFIKAINDGTSIKLFNNGEMYRDFTYVGDVAKAIKLLMLKMHEDSQQEEIGVPYKIFNVGHEHPIKIMDLITTIEEALGKKAIIEERPIQAGDMIKTLANTSKLYKEINYIPDTNLKTGIEKTVKWYLEKCEKIYSYS